MVGFGVLVITVLIVPVGVGVLVDIGVEVGFKVPVGVGVLVAVGVGVFVAVGVALGPGHVQSVSKEHDWFLHFFPDVV